MYKRQLLILGLTGLRYGLNRVANQFKEWQQPYLTENSQPSDDSLSVNVSSMDIDNSILQQLQTMDLPSSQLKQITNHIEEYPERMLEALTKNEELLDYVLAYPENKDRSDKEQPIDLNKDLSLIHIFFLSAGRRLCRMAGADAFDRSVRRGCDPLSRINPHQ